MVDENFEAPAGEQPVASDAPPVRSVRGKQVSFLAAMPKWAWIAGAAALVLILVVAVALGLKGGGDSPQPADEPAASAPETPEAEPASQTGGQWVVVTLVDGSIVYARLADEGPEGYLATDASYFVAGVGQSADEDNVLRRFGSEVHAPEGGLLIPETSVLYTEPLTETSGALEAILADQKSDPSPENAVEFGGGRMSAVFLANGEVYFGALTVSEGALVIDDVYFLRFTDEEAAELGTIESLDQVELVARSAMPSAPSGELRVPASSVLYAQTLSEESPIIAALKAQADGQ